MDYLYKPELLTEHLQRVKAGEAPESIPFAGATEVIFDLLMLAGVIPLPQIPGPGKTTHHAVSSVNRTKLIDLAASVVNYLSLDLHFLIRKLPYEAQRAILLHLSTDRAESSLASIQLHRWTLVDSTPRGSQRAMGSFSLSDQGPSKAESATAIEDFLAGIGEGNEVFMYGAESAQVPAQQIKCQLHFDLGVHLVMLGDLDRAKTHLNAALDLFEFTWATPSPTDEFRYVSFETRELAGFLVACDSDAVSRVVKLPEASISSVVVAYVQISPETADRFIDACLADNLSGETPPPLRRGLTSAVSKLPWVDDDFRARMTAVSLVHSAMFAGMSTPTPKDWSAVCASQPAVRLAFAAFRDAYTAAPMRGATARIRGAFGSWQSQLRSMGMSDLARTIASEVAPELFGLGMALEIHATTKAPSFDRLSESITALVQVVRRAGADAVPADGSIRQAKRLRLDDAHSWEARLDIVAALPPSDASSLEEALALVHALKGQPPDVGASNQSTEDLMRRLRSAISHISEPPLPHFTDFVAIALDQHDRQLLTAMSEKWNKTLDRARHGVLVAVKSLEDVHSILYPTNGSDARQRADELLPKVGDLCDALCAQATVVDKRSAARRERTLSWECTLSALASVQCASVLRLIAQCLAELHNHSIDKNSRRRVEFDPEWAAKSGGLDRKDMLRDALTTRRIDLQLLFAPMLHDLLEMFLARPWCPHGCRRALGILYSDRGNTTIALRMYLDEVSVQSAFFQRAITRTMLPNGLVKDIAQCLIDLRAYVQAVAVLQHESTVDYARAHSALTKSASVDGKQLRARGCDEYLRFVYDAALLEVLLQQYISSPQYRTKIISLLGRASFSDGAVLESAVVRLRSGLFEALANEYCK